MAKKKNRKKELRHQVREENSPSMECKVDIKEGETYFAHNPIQNGAQIIHPFKLQKFSNGTIAAITPAYTTDESLQSVLQKSLLRRDEIEIESLVKKVLSFIKNESNYTFNELKEFIDKIISIDEFGSYIQNNHKALGINKNAEFYRAIPLVDESGNLKIDFDPNTWRFINPNSSLQRLNTEKESVFYTSVLDRVAIEEVGIKKQTDKFALFVYNAKDNFKILPIQVNPFCNVRFPKELQDYGLQTTKVLNEIFSSKSSGDVEHDKKVYELSNYIIERYFPLSRNKEYKGWSYISVAFKDAIDYKSNYQDDRLDLLCIAFPKDTYDKCLDMSNVTCVMFNCTDEEMRLLNLSYSKCETEKNRIIKGELK